MDNRPNRPLPGAYGLRLDGLASSSAPSSPPDWPLATIRQRPRTDDGGTPRVTPDSVEVPLIEDGWLSVDRRDMTATYWVRSPLSDEDILHPYLAAAAAWFSHWLGRETFHGGAVVVDGRAYALVGEKEAGKSSLLAWFSQRGVEVVTDDLLVLEGELLFTGPRCIDLRSESVLAQDETERFAIVRGGTRNRVALPQTSDSWPFGGWILLDWGAETSMRNVAPRDRLSRLAPHRVLRVPPSSPGHLLQLATLPMWELTRVKEWGAMDGVADLVSSTVAGAV